MGEGGNLANFMPERRVAAGALDLMVGDMLLMHELRGKFSAQEDGFIMTFHALSLWHMAISLDDAEMTLLASDPPGNILLVIEAPTLDPDIPFRFHVAGSTSSDGT